MRKSAVRFEISVATRAGTTSISAATAPAASSLLDVVVNLQRLRRRLADRLEAAGPGRARRNQADVTDDRNAFGRELGDRVEAAGAIRRRRRRS